MDSVERYDEEKGIERMSVDDAINNEVEQFRIWLEGILKSKPAEFNSTMTTERRWIRDNKHITITKFSIEEKLIIPEVVNK